MLEVLVALHSAHLVMVVDMTPRGGVRCARLGRTLSFGGFRDFRCREVASAMGFPSTADTPRLGL